MRRAGAHPCGEAFLRLAHATLLKDAGLASGSVHAEKACDALLSQRLAYVAYKKTLANDPRRLDSLSPRLPVITGTGGRLALPMRLIAGLLYLKHAYDLSDEAVCERWLENPYWQFFTGEVVFQTCLPCDSSSLTRWRQRLGEAGMEELLAHTINTAHAMKAVDAAEVSRVIVDTTVQEKSDRPSHRQLFA